MNPYFRAFSGPVDWNWMRKHVPVLRVEDTSGIVAIDLEKNETVGMVLFDNWTRNSVQSHIAITDSRVLKYGFIQECLDYVFNVRGKKKLYGLVAGDNIKALKLDKHIGFVEVARLNEAYDDGVDYVILEMTRESSKYIPEPAKLAVNG